MRKFAILLGFIPLMAIVGLIFFVYWTVFRPAAVVSYRYRLTVAVEIGEQVRSGSSVIGVRYSFNQKGLPPSWGVYNEYVSGQAVLIDIGDRGALVASLSRPIYASGLKYNNCTVDAGELMGRAHEPASALHLCEEGYPVSLENERAISQTQGSIDLPTDNLPTFIWLPDNSDPRSARFLKPTEFSAVIGDAARLVSARVEITHDPIVIDIDRRLPLYKNIPQPPRGGPFVLPNGLALHWGMFIAPGSVL